MLSTHKNNSPSIHYVNCKSGVIVSILSHENALHNKSSLIFFLFYNWIVTNGKVEI